jgi:nucleotide-binding universal stress UspA family protein
MTYKTILYAMQDDAGNEARLGIAKALARRWGGSVVALHTTAPAVIPVGFAEGVGYLPPEVIEAQQAAAARVTEKMKEAFRRVCEPVDVPARWRHEQGDLGGVGSKVARSADLTVVGAMPTSGIDALAMSPIEQLVLGTGGPVLVLPAGWSEPTIGRRVVLAWNDSRESARAMHDARGFLGEAEAVTVAALGEDVEAGLADVVAALKAHGIAAEPHSEADAGDAGGALLRIAGERQADLLVMGAYGRARLRELILGGATRDVLRNAALPVLFSG